MIEERKNNHVLTHFKVYILYVLHFYVDVVKYIRMGRNFYYCLVSFLFRKNAGRIVRMLYIFLTSYLVCLGAS